MGVATRPGAFGLFTAAWAVMMAAMMLPGAAPAFARHARASGTMRAALPFAGSYLAIWVLAGVAAYALDRPHGALAAGVVVIVAGGYELTPVKRRFRQRCRAESGSGLGYGLVALDVMSLSWMAVITVVASAQKALPAKAVVDVPVALAIAGLGLAIVIAPSLVPGLMPPAM